MKTLRKAALWKVTKGFSKDMIDEIGLERYVGICSAKREFLNAARRAVEGKRMNRNWGFET